MTARWFHDGALHFGLGVENTFVPQSAPGERAIDEFALTDHYRQWSDDLQRAADVGATFLRWGPPWYRVNPAPGEWDWSWTDLVLERMGELGIRPIVDLVHYGTPLWMPRQFLDRDYPQRVAEYGAAFAARYGELATDYTPLNEPMIHALFTGEYGYWPPYRTGEAGLVALALPLARGLALTQHAIRDVLGAEAAFVHVDATLRYVGAVDAAEHRDTAHRYIHQATLVEDLVCGFVDHRHPLAPLLARHGVGDAELAWFRANPARPDVMGVNYYPQHSTELFEPGVHHAGGFADPRPTVNRGAAGLRETLAFYAERYGVPVMLAETAVTADEATRAEWLTASVREVEAMRAEGVDVVGYTWWPLFDMYEWTYRHSALPRAAHRLTMGLYDLVETPGGLERRRNSVADVYASLAGARVPHPAG